MKLLVIAVLLGILYSLGSALVYMVKDKGQSTRTVRMLTYRIGLSVALFILLLTAYGLGFIEPNRLTP